MNTILHEITQLCQFWSFVSGSLKGCLMHTFTRRKSFCLWKNHSVKILLIVSKLIVFSLFTTIVVCFLFSLITYFGGLHCKQNESWSDCSLKSSLIRIHSVCFPDKICLVCIWIYAADLIKRRLLIGNSNRSVTQWNVLYTFQFPLYQSDNEPNLQGFFVCLIWFFTSHQQSFSYTGTGLPGLNQYKARINVSCSRTTIERIYFSRLYI